MSLSCGLRQLCRLGTWWLRRNALPNRGISRIGDWSYVSRTTGKFQGSSVAMDDVVIDMTNPDTLLAEVRRLRAEIVHLEKRVELLDRLAHQDVLIDMPNRRGFLRALEAA